MAYWIGRFILASMLRYETASAYGGSGPRRVSVWPDDSPDFVSSVDRTSFGPHMTHHIRSVMARSTTRHDEGARWRFGGRDSFDGCLRTKTRRQDMPSSHVAWALTVACVIFWGLVLVLLVVYGLKKVRARRKSLDSKEQPAQSG